MLNLKIFSACSAVMRCRKPQRLAERINTIRKKSNYKRPQLNTVLTDQLQELKASIFNCRTDLTTGEWQNVQETLINNYKHINTNNIDAVILGVCSNAEQLSLAKDYIRHLRASGLDPNTATLGRLLRVYNAAYHARGCASDALTTEEQKEILEIYASFRKKYDVLDAVSCESLIHGIIATEQWRDGEELIEMMKLSCTPSTAAYTALSTKAFHMGDMQLGWRLLEEMMENRKQPKCEILLAYLNEIFKNVNDFHQNFETLLKFLENYEVIITEKVANCIEAIAKHIPSVLIVTPTKLNRIGKCESCGNFMQNVAISDAEFTKLSDLFLTKVLIRNDVFQKSTPEEVDIFKHFVAKTGPYDCVIDGLNVAYSMGAKKPPSVLANLLASVVKYFNNRNKHVLVLGRKHMNSWPKGSMQYVRKNASIFLTNNLSHDDPFLLYATINSGQGTDFFSRDLMRSHAFLLGPELKTIFRRWQQEHQYSLITKTESGKIIVKEPIRHLMFAHKVKNTWHLPYKQEYSSNPTETFEVPEKWLCIEFQK